LRAVQRPYGHNKHINAIWRAQNAVKREHVGANRGDDVLVWPLDHRFLKMKLKLKIMSDDIFLVFTCNISFRVFIFLEHLTRRLR
jgi:hypothetical protein